MEETGQYETPPKCSGLPPTGLRNHRPDGPKANHALTVKLDHSSGADHSYGRYRSFLCSMIAWVLRKAVDIDFDSSIWDSASPADNCMERRKSAPLFQAAFKCGIELGRVCKVRGMTGSINPFNLPRASGNVGGKILGRFG